MTNPPENQPPQNPYAGRYGQNPPEDESLNPYAGRYGTNPPGYEANKQQGQSPYGQQPQYGQVPQYQQPEYENGLPMAPRVDNGEYRDQEPISPEGFRVGDAVRFGWQATKATIGTWIFAILLVGALSMGIVYATNRFVRDLFDVYRLVFELGGDIDPDRLNYLIALIPPLSGTEILMAIFGMIIVGVLFAGVSHMGLRAARGERPTIADMVAIPNFTKVFITVAFIQVLATTAGVLPGVGLIIQIVVSFLTMFTVYYVLDRGDDTFTALSRSMSLVVTNLGFVIVLALASAGLAMLGFVAFVFGLLVTIPIIICAVAIGYVVLSQKTARRY